MTRRFEPVPLVETGPDGEIVYNLDAGAANADWIRAARLRKRAEQGDREAAAELARLSATIMSREVK